MSSERGKNGFRAAYPNSGLESLAQEASRRAESMDTETEAREERENSESKSPRSPTNPKGKVAYSIQTCPPSSRTQIRIRLISHLQF